MKTLVVTEPWDNLIILDACRYDSFERLNTVPGKLHKKISAGSNTKSWAHSNFNTTKTRRLCDDITYISANPVISSYLFGKHRHPFNNKIDLWDTAWDSVYKTVLPSSVNDAVYDASNRMIVHYLQPHHPFIADHGMCTNDAGVDINKIANGEKEDPTMTIWELFSTGKVSKEDMIYGYEQTLLLVLEYVKELLPRLSGRTVISSDHGNMFDKGLSGHPWKPYKKHKDYSELFEVPWLEVLGG